MTALRSLTPALAAVTLAIGCGGGDEAAGTKTSTAAAATTSKIDGKFDVGGHKLYMRCRGDGSPTIVYMHGSITEGNVVPHENGASYLELARRQVPGLRL